MGSDSFRSTSQPAASAARLPYVPGLDGLRAVAVIAVLLYHAGLARSGGFLGVETFFVLSGFLITALLVVEWRQHDRINLPAFWLRRARRLLPALMFMLVGTLIFAAVALRREPAVTPADVLGTLGYVMNWRLILGEHPYFDPMLRPPLLQHVWSLAVEEQFYLLWPLIFAGAIRWLRPVGLLALTLVVAAGSAALMALLYQPGADPSRIYYGTDTRAAGLLLGAALALVWTPGRTPASTERRLGLLLDGAGLLALALLVACFVALSSRHPLLYRGGFALVAILTVVVIAALTHPQARLVPRLLGSPPLRWIGLRSYGLYLWHWPVFQVTRPRIDLPLDGLPLFLLRLAILGALVELSYRYVELPARHGAIERTWRKLRGTPSAAQPVLPRRSRRVTYAMSTLGVILLSLLLLPLGSGVSRRPSSQATMTTALAVSTERPSAFDPAMAALSATPADEPAAERAGAPVPVEPVTQITAPEPAVTQPSMTATPVAATTTPSAPQPLDPALVAELQRLLNATVADGYIPGAVLSVGIPGHLPWNGASGLADRQGEQLMAPDTQIHIASITKMFTAVVVLQLAEEGRIDLNAPIGSYLPGIIRFEQSTSVRHLLSHTSGLYDYLEDAEFLAAAYQNPARTWNPRELVAMIDQFGVAFEPGTPASWMYASTNYVLLGILVEQVTGRPLAAEMRQRIFDPLGLTHTFFAPDEAPVGSLAHGSIGGSDRAGVSMTFVFGTANVISTVDDLRRFIEALFEGRLLRPESWAQMGTLVDTGGAYDMPELEYGLGLMSAQMNVGPRADGTARPDELTKVLGHIGGVAGFRAAAWRVPESGITITLALTQADVDPNLLARDALNAVLTWQGR